jgi:hypothetical protein
MFEVYGAEFETECVDFQLPVNSSFVSYFRFWWIFCGNTTTFKIRGEFAQLRDIATDQASGLKHSVKLVQSFSNIECD